MTRARQKAGRSKMPTDARIRKALEADFQQYFIDALTPDRGYSTPIDNVKALILTALGLEKGRTKL